MMSLCVRTGTLGMDGESAPLPTPRKRSPTHYPILCMSLSTVWSFSELQNELTVDLVSVDLVCKLVSQSPIRSMHQQGDQMHSDYCRGLLHSQGLAGARRGSQGLAGARRGSQGLAGARRGSQGLAGARRGSQGSGSFLRYGK
jgi:hypothetical protein